MKISNKLKSAVLAAVMCLGLAVQAAPSCSDWSVEIIGVPGTSGTGVWTGNATLMCAATGLEFSKSMYIQDGNCTTTLDLVATAKQYPFTLTMTDGSYTYWQDVQNTIVKEGKQNKGIVTFNGGNYWKFQPRYLSPVYVDDIAANGIDHWVTNTVPDGYTVITDELEPYWGAEDETSWYVVTNDVKISDGVVCAGHVNLLLCSGAKLTVTAGIEDAAGIQTDEYGSFTIYGEPEGYGELMATGGMYGAGIGGSAESAGANITINGGKVTATGGSLDFEATSDGCGAGIGGGAEGIGANITINGGEVTARGFCGGAGIGGGFNALSESCRDIVINGGVVIASSGVHEYYPGAGIGSGGDSDGVEGITINGGTVWVRAEENGDGLFTGDYIGAGGAGTASGVTIAAEANMMFDLVGADDAQGLSALPEFEGCRILTPETADVQDRVLVGGMDESGAAGVRALPWALTNAVTGATGEVEVNGGKVPFASQMLGLTYGDDTLMLTVVEASLIAPKAVANTTFEIYTNDVSIGEGVSSIIVEMGMPAYVVYTADSGYLFSNGSTAVTNTIDTLTNPATVEAPAAPVKQLQYVAPVYVDDIAANGIDHWVTNTVDSYKVVTSAVSRLTWGSSGATRWFVATNGTYQIDGGVKCKGHVNLILCNDAKLTVTNVADHNAGIATDVNGSLTIYGTPDGAGELIVTGGSASAGIGGGYEVAASNITINGGTVTTTGGSCGAGIGGGDKRVGAYITVNGGTVTASGGHYGSGIGGGNEGSGSNITINGGTVIATGDEGAGIGGGAEKGVGSDITINGGTITTTSSQYGAGIGGGNKREGKNITINGGTIMTTGGKNAAGIGAGHDGPYGKNITINGGTISATGGSGGAAIGAGTKGLGLNITINNGTITAIGGNQSTAIGGGRYGSATNIAINAGVIWVANRGLYEFIGSSVAETPASNVTIAAAAKVMFDLTSGGSVSPGQTLPAWKDFAITTPATQTVSRVLVGGIENWTCTTVFALTNAVTSSTNTIVLGGIQRFASANLRLKHADNQLALIVFDAIQVGDDAWAYIEDGLCTIFGADATWAKSEWTDGNPLKPYDAAITNLVVQDGVTALGANSFENMWYVQDVTLAPTVTNVGARTFKKCYGLTTVTSLTTGASSVGDYAFSGCHSLQGLSFAGATSFGTQSYTLQAAIYMKDGGIPVVYAMPTISVAGKTEHILGKKTLGEADWTDVTGFTDEEKKPYHFFKIEMQ